jgi:hypothetical protein
MLGLLLGIVIGAVATVSSTVVYNWVVKQKNSAEAVVTKAAANTISKAL